MELHNTGKIKLYKLKTCKNCSKFDQIESKIFKEMAYKSVTAGELSPVFTFALHLPHGTVSNV